MKLMEVMLFIIAFNYLVFLASGPEGLILWLMFAWIIMPCLYYLFVDNNILGRSTGDGLGDIFKISTQFWIRIMRVCFPPDDPSYADDM